MSKAAHTLHRVVLTWIVVLTMSGVTSVFAQQHAKNAKPAKPGVTETKDADARYPDGLVSDGPALSAAGRAALERIKTDSGEEGEAGAEQEPMYMSLSVPSSEATPVNLAPVTPVLSPPLKNVAPILPSGERGKRTEHEPPRPAPLPEAGPDTARQIQFGATISAPSPAGVSFDGVGVGLAGFAPSSNPPDVNGHVGATQYVQWNNTSFAVFDKSGNLLYGPAEGNTLFQSLGGDCASHNDGDPVVNYDLLAGRWILSQFVVGGSPNSSHQCVAISVTGDATGAYYLYDFVTDATNFVDYPHMAVWPDGYYMTTHVFNAAGTAYVEGRIHVFERSQMLQGLPARQLQAAMPAVSGQQQYGFLAADLDSLTPPPAGEAEFVLGPDPSNGPGGLTHIASTRVAVVWGATPSITVSGTTRVSVTSPGNAACSGTNRQCVPQPAPAAAADYLDNLGFHFMHRLAYRNFGGAPVQESLVANQTGGSTVGHATIRWYEFRNAGSSATDPTVFQQSSYDPDSNWRWMGSIAMDKDHDIALGYSKSSTSVIPGIYMTGRLGTDTINTMGAEATVQAGIGVQQGGANRWGDYSSMTLDPVDQCTFWYTNEYLKTNGAFNWSTRIAAYKFPSCTAAPAWATVTGTVTSCDTGAPLSGVVVTLSNGYAAATNASGVYSILVPAGSYTATAKDTDRNCTTSSSVAVSAVSGGTTTQDFCLSGSSNLKFNSITIDDATNGNNNGVVNRNECIKLNVGVKNSGCANESAISSTISTTTPGVTIGQNASTYPDLAIDGSSANSTAFQFATSNTFVCGTVINFTLNLTYASGSKAIGFSIPTCSGGADQTIPSSSLTAADLTQGDRLGRDSIPSTCAGKTCPGGGFAGTKYYKTYTFSNNSGADACYTVNINAAAGGAGDIESAAYAGTYNPANLCNNYLGDSGVTGLGTTRTTASYSFTVPALSNFVVVVNTTGTTTSSTFSGTVSGFVDDTAGPGPCPACVPPAAPTAGNGGPYVSGDTIQLTASSIPSATYSWTGPNSFTSTLQNPTIVNATTANAGTYSVTATVANCTSSAATTNVVVTARPTTTTVTAASGTYGGTAALSATVIASGGAPVVGQTVTFTLNGSAFAGNTAITDGSGIATIASASLSGINANTYPTGVGASFAGTTELGTSSGTNSLTIGKATPTVTAAGGTYTYDALSHPATGDVLGVGGVSIGSPTFAYTPGGATAPLNAGSYSATGSYAGDTNYNPASSAPVAITINQATPTITGLADATFTYDTTSHAASANVVGVGSADLGPATISYAPGGATAPVNAGTYTVTASFAGDTNYTSATANATYTINKATPTITGLADATFTYDTTSHAASANVVGVGSADLGPATISYAPGGATAPVNAGTYTVTASFAGDTNYTSATANATYTINQATPTISGLANATYTYDTSSHAATASVLGVGGADLGAASISYAPGGATAPVNAGSYGVTASFAGDTNYTSATANATITINQATPTITGLADATFTYDASSHAATASVVGVGGADLGAATITYAPGGATAPMNAGTYGVTASFAGDTNYTSATANATFTINQATPTVNVTGGTYTYDATPHAATGSVTGVGGANLGTPTFTYDGLPTAPTNAGTYAVVASFAGNTNYTAASNNATLTIDKATPTVGITGGTFTYDANPHAASGTVTGVGGENLGAPTITYNPGGATVPVNAGTYGVTGSYAGSANYNPATGTGSIVIDPATPTVSVTGGVFAFDGNPHAATGSVTGVNNENLGTPTFTYNGSPTVPVSVGTYNVVGSYASGGNYTSATGNATLFIAGPPTISKAFGAATIPFNGTTTLTFTIDNANAGLSLNGVAFTDAFPSGLEVANPANVTNNCGGTFNAVPAATSVDLTGGVVAAASPCTIVLDVKGTSVGTKNNTTGTISSTEGGTGATSNTATVEVTATDVMAPVARITDPSGNRVFEPGETVTINTSWINNTTFSMSAQGTASNFSGPAGATYTIADALADYGTAAGGATVDCASTLNCYSFTVSNPTTRPAAHWDVTFDETLSTVPGTTTTPHTWTLHIGNSFFDVASTNGYYRFIETLFHNNVTGGCGGGNYCPGNSVTRAQMAVFLLKAKHGSAYVPPPATGTMFLDVPVGSFAASFIEQLANEGVTGGCGGGNYCPSGTVTRAQMAVFLLKTKFGAAWTPPAATGTMFLDVPLGSFAGAYIEELAREGITGGCGGGNYCPTNPNTRGQMAPFITVTFGLTQ